MGIRLSTGKRNSNRIGVGAPVCAQNGSIGMETGETALAAAYAREAEAAAASAREAAVRQPIVGVNGNWQIWDQGSGAYADTGIRAEGPAGPPGPKGDAGMPNVWFGTLEEYNALSVIAPDVTYFLEEPL